MNKWLLVADKRNEKRGVKPSRGGVRGEEEDARDQGETGKTDSRTCPPVGYVLFKSVLLLLLTKEPSKIDRSHFTLSVV